VNDDSDEGDSDGTPLPGNPALREVVPAGTGDRTSMIDLEAVQAKRAARRAEEEGDADDVDSEKTPPPERPVARDPDATGTLARKGKKQQSQVRLVRDEQSRVIERTERVAAVVDDAGDDDAGPASQSRTGTRTGMTRGTRGGTQTLKRPPPKAKQPMSPVAAASVVLIGVVGLIVAVFVAVRATGVLTVTSVPLGAAVTVDGAVIGTSPLQKRVRTGSHVVELALAGYEPFREVVDVPSAGLSFLQPLKALPPPPPPPPTAFEIATDIAAQAKRLFDAGDLDGAMSRVVEIEKLVTDHGPSRELRDAVKGAIAKREADAAASQANAATQARFARARQLNDEGLKLYNAGKLGPARTALYDSLKLDAKNPDPHRTLAKIFNREDEVDKVRYHLTRFLELGGNDGDFKVREWLKAHAK
jgi:hypothetical protein